VLIIQVTAESRCIRLYWLPRLLVRGLLLRRLLSLLLFALVGSFAVGQRAPDPSDVDDLPDAPQSQTPAKPSDAQPASAAKKCPPPSKSAQGLGGSTGGGESPKAAVTPCRQKFDFEYPFGKPPKHGQRLTSTDKLRMAASDVVDPFNLLTIGATAAISVGSNPQSHYGPGIEGWAKNSGTLLTEDMTGAFFITYLIPSIAKQDPRYYRMPNASIPRRIANVLIQPVWSRSDNGGHMPNYGMLIGVPAAVTLANIYVPGRKQGVWPTVETSAIAIGTSPIDHLVDEFLPDVAKHVSIHIVLIQRIVNHLTLTEGSS
jgi:hypothetical protein